MKQNAEVVKNAKKLFALSFVNESLDEKRVLYIVSEVLKDKTREKNALISAYTKLISEYIRYNQIQIEIPKGFSISQSEVELLAKKTKAKYTRIVESEKNIFGAKITHGDWVYDNTLAAKLNNIKNTI